MVLLGFCDPAEKAPSWGGFICLRVRVPFFESSLPVELCEGMLLVSKSHCFGFRINLFGFRIILGFRTSPFCFGSTSLGFRSMFLGFRIILGFQTTSLGSNQPSGFPNHSWFSNQPFWFPKQAVTQTRCTHTSWGAVG